MGKVFFVEQPQGEYREESRAVVCWLWQFINQISNLVHSLLVSGTLPRNMNGSSSFCKGPRTSKV